MSVANAQRGQIGASGSNARLTATDNCRILASDIRRGRRFTNWVFRIVVMKWPFSHETPGSPVSADGIENAVGPSWPALAKGTTRTELTGTIFRLSSDTITTQC